MADIFSLAGKNILVTGASSGIGKKCASVCSEAGANMILVGRNSERLTETFETLNHGGRHLQFICDITQYNALEDIIAQTHDKVGPISGFIHSAGVEMTLPLRDMKVSSYESLLGPNVIAGFEIAKFISKKKYASQSGASFIFISSVMGLLGQPGKIGYCASKGALIAGVRAMALELAAKNIRANCILPGVVVTQMTEKAARFIDTEHMQAIKQMHPLGLGVPEDIAHACIFLLSDASRWITGTDLTIDGGYSAQ